MPACRPLCAASRSNSCWHDLRRLVLPDKSTVPRVSNKIERYKMFLDLPLHNNVFIRSTLYSLPSELQRIVTSCRYVEELPLFWTVSLPRLSIGDRTFQRAMTD
ncbi:hypothetical protein J6590_021618 [Homalodisca vitripennis]|nr:hypothetical protein J6590_021618 [Homalodisca vitripennis]